MTAACLDKGPVGILGRSQHLYFFVITSIPDCHLEYRSGTDEGNPWHLKIKQNETQRNCHLPEM